jgi:hypothetical protein
LGALLTGSLLLLVVAAATVVFGWIAASTPLLWISIGSSGLAGLMIATAYSLFASRFR